MLTEVGYDEKTRTLRAVFKNGATFDYADVPPREYAGLMAAESKGVYFSTVIKAHPFVRVTA